MRTFIWNQVALIVVLSATQAAWPLEQSKEDAKLPPQGAAASATQGDGNEPQAPAKSKRARLLGTHDLQGSWSGLHWTPDGKHLIVASDSEVHFFEAAKVGMQKPGVAVPGMAFSNWLMGFTPDGSDLMTYAGTQGRVNAVAKVQFWRIDQVRKSGEVAKKPHREVELEANDIQPLRFSADGKTLLGMRMIERPAGQAAPNRQAYSISIHNLDAKTGDTLNEVMKLEDLVYPSFQRAFSPNGDSLFVQLQSDDGSVLQCRDTKTGRMVWEREVVEPALSQRYPKLVASLDGALLAAEQVVAPPALAPMPQPKVGKKGKGGGGFGGQFGQAGNNRPAWRQIPVLYNAKTGQTGIGLQLDLGMNGKVLAFSHDGRFAAGEVSAESNNQRQLVIWELKNGNVVKRWAHHNSVDVAFHPNRLELAVLETRHVYVGKDSHRYEATLGLWDLAPLQK